MQQDRRTQPRASNHDTYERVRRTLDEALAELQLPTLDRDDASGIIKLYQPSR